METLFIAIAVFIAFVLFQRKRNSSEKFVVSTAPPPNIYDIGVNELKQNMLDTKMYSLSVEPHYQTPDGVSEDLCSKFPGSYEWFQSKCRPKLVVDWSGWTVVPLGSRSMFGDKFIEVEPTLGQGAPFFWKPGMIIRWEGSNPKGGSGIDGDYTIAKVEIIGEKRRLWLEIPNGTVHQFYWGRPEVQITKMR